MGKNKTVGDLGEKLAEDYLIKRGYCLIERNYRNRFGEMDLIACEGSSICFVEVKTRLSEDYGTPFEAVSWRKQKKLKNLALSYLQSKGLLDENARFDVVAVNFDEGHQPRIELLQNAFEVD
jgi:putative endonuclease